MALITEGDLSTLGGDWDNESFETSNYQQQQQHGEAGSVGSAGDIDDDDVAADLKRYHEANELVVEGFRCPDEFLNMLTPMEFEDMVHMFVKFDANFSGTIDKHETKKILTFLGMEASLNRAEELIAIVDTDKSGEIDFDEFCAFIVMMKRGDERLQGFNKLLTMFNESPLGELERQVKNRSLKMQFLIAEKREATLTMPTTWVVELQLTGQWHYLENGEVKAATKTKRFQGLGNTTKDAKYKAAQAAILNMGESMPGVHYKEGEFPEEWLQWMEDNLLRGVEPGQVVSILASKGFHPHKNMLLMHRLLTWNSLQLFQRKHPEVQLLVSTAADGGEEEALDEEVFEWIKDTAQRGIDGAVIHQLLYDRCIDLDKYHLHFAQQLKNNELGCLIDLDGRPAQIMDFYHACKMGYLEEVVLYCKCGIDTNEERVDRHTSQRWTPLMYAADGGHADVCRELLKYGANANAVDLRGRRALHYAAAHGHADTCAVLLDGGTMMFAGDMQRNTPLHLACQNNHMAAMDFLAFKGLELTRLMTSDKVVVKKGGSFETLAGEVFKLMPMYKLTKSDTVRFEKCWLNDAANMFLTLMDDGVKHMLAPSCAEIMDDVLLRFDPRPETGVFVTATATGEQVFVKTVPAAAELAVLLKYTFRQAALDPINNWKRTPLHLACDANQINSHEKLILRLIDFHGCNVQMCDIHSKRPIDLLVQDKYMGNMPTSTQVREELLIERREESLVALFKRFSEEDQQRTESRREQILAECVAQDKKITQRLWHVVRRGSVFKRRYEGTWELYEDPDSQNYFYTQMPRNPLMGDEYSQYTWSEPAAGKAIIDKGNALIYLLRVRCTFLRNFDEWMQYRCNKTGIEFYFNARTEEVQFTAPKHLQWRSILRGSTKTQQQLGYGNEWVVFEDKFGNNFYRNRISHACAYDQPPDAIEVTPADMLCTAYQFKGKAIEQKWYSCEQCNRAWKSTPEGANRTVKICEPCVVRCHKGHKGVRYMRTSTAICICTAICRVTNNICRACVVSDTQKRAQSDAINIREEKRRQLLRNEEQPPIFTLVPRYFADGSLKSESGWRICRVCRSSEGDSTRDPLDDGDLLIDDNGDNAELSDTDDSSTGSQSAAPASVGSESRADDISLASSVVKKKIDWSSKEKPARPGLPLGWYEVYDVEEPYQLQYQDRVLCLRYSGIPREYGRIKLQVKPGFYKVQFENRALPDEVLERSYIELISRPKFYSNPSTGQAAWSVDQAVQSPINSQSLTMTGADWIKYYYKSALRRSFGEWEEMYNSITDSIFYVQHDNFAMERAALQMQSTFRSRMRIMRPWADWKSISFTFDTPAVVTEMKEEIKGWAYLRRRSLNVGEFLDVVGNEWEEYMDRHTFEYLYWQETENVYRWDKPDLYQRKTDVKDLFQEGQDVMYQFPGRRVEEVAVITKQRFDDETGEDMYDLVHKYTPELAFKWVKRMHIKQVPKEGDALLLSKLEVQWRNVLKRRREADERKAKRERDEALAEEMRRQEKMKTMAYRLGKRDEDENKVGQHTRIMRGRLERIDMEAQEVKEEIELLEGNVRRKKVEDDVERARQEQQLTRAEVLSLSRSLEMKLQMEDRVDKRNKLRLELLEKRREAKERTVFIEESLRDQEMHTTTPRSQVRRRIVRRLHIAMQRQREGLVICEWGCGDWFRAGHEQADHQQRRCVRRIMPCTLGCGLKHTEELWLKEYCAPCSSSSTGNGGDENNNNGSGGGSAEDDESQQGPRPISGFNPPPKTPAKEAAVLGVITNQQHHETEECVKRLMMCPKQCLEWVTFEKLEFHLTELCTKRPAKPLECRLGCGQKFGGQVEYLIQAEDDRLEHEQEQCEFRIVRCNWQFNDGRICASQMRADERAAHRDYHLNQQGMLLYCVPGTYMYRVPKNMTRMKVQLWGAGGGSGYFYGRQGGAGGGGAFVEALVAVEPHTVLELVVGSGGGAGQNGAEITPVGIDYQRQLMQARREVEIHLPKHQRYQHRPEDDAELAPSDRSCGVTLGGYPGGGDGYGGAGCWASGGGGGYTAISKRTKFGTTPLLVAAGGGGGASLPGLPGAATEGALPGALLDPVNGHTATPDSGGKAGESGSTFNAAWPATAGEAWQGGGGCEYGAGGGGGVFGGGGGGTMPGISGGGGGGTSYLFEDMSFDFVTIAGHGIEPGGLGHNPPQACGVGEWDKVGGLAGQGGRPDAYSTTAGNNGAIRLIKPGYY